MFPFAKKKSHFFVKMDEEVEEEFYVVLDIKDSLDDANKEGIEEANKSTYAVSVNSYSITSYTQGLDSSTPFLQLGKKVFSGRWQPIVGTFLLFEEKSKRLSDESVNNLFHNLFQDELPPKYSYAGKTFKKIEFERVELLSKDLKNKKRKNIKPEDGNSKQAKTSNEVPSSEQSNSNLQNFNI